MVTEEAGLQVGHGSPKRDENAPTPPSNDETTLKRKASPVDVDHNDDGKSTKRQRQGEDAREQPPASASELHRRESWPPRRPSSHDESSRDRRDSASQEEKKRGKRLFGGLLSTLSQTNTNLQHRRRQEIERRQQERLQKQRDEDDLRRAEKLSKIRETRLVEQVEFQEQVMRHRHSKMLALAEFLKTKAEPTIYYSPWKRTADQEDIIDEQIRAAKITIAKEEDDFKALKQRHASRYGSREDSDRCQDKTDEGEGKKITTQPEEPEELEKDDAAAGQGHADVPKTAAQHDPHDESGYVLVDADEDMVIY